MATFDELYTRINSDLNNSLRKYTSEANFFDLWDADLDDELDCLSIVDPLICLVAEKHTANGYVLLQEFTDGELDYNQQDVDAVVVFLKANEPKIHELYEGYLYLKAAKALEGDAESQKDAFYSDIAANIKDGWV